MFFAMFTVEMIFKVRFIRSFICTVDTIIWKRKISKILLKSYLNIPQQCSGSKGTHPFSVWSK